MTYIIIKFLENIINLLLYYITQNCSKVTSVHLDIQKKITGETPRTPLREGSFQPPSRALLLVSCLRHSFRRPTATYRTFGPTGFHINLPLATHLKLKLYCIYIEALNNRIESVSLDRWSIIGILFKLKP